MDAGFHQMPSLPGLAATIVCPIPAACAPVGRSRKREPSLPVGLCAAPLAATSAETPTLVRSRLINQHNGDVVAHRVPQPALRTKQRLLRFAVFELAFALRADEDFKQSR